MAISYCLTHAIGFFFEGHRPTEGCRVDVGPGRPHMGWWKQAEKLISAQTHCIHHHNDPECLALCSDCTSYEYTGCKCPDACEVDW